MTRPTFIANVARALISIFALAIPSMPGQTASPNPQSAQDAEAQSSQIYLGFDANDYPGDQALPALRQTFAFSGYWLNVPPGAKTNPWTGKRAALLKNGFGFLILFNGRMSSELKPPVNPDELGARDGDAAVAAALREGFRATTGTVIFLDVEEGGRMLPSQLTYIGSWASRVNSRGFIAGVYCSGMKVKEGKSQTITTADDIHERLPISAYFVYNDACPPSPGCAYPKNPPPPANSGFSGARVWQFAQSPRRRNFTTHCSATYNADGNCYPPQPSKLGNLLLDLDSSVSADPSALGIHIIK
jgi:Domain of unknown function (DUF1906)